MDGDRCAFVTCHNGSEYTWLGLPICQRHWEKICTYHDWQDMPVPDLRRGFKWPKRATSTVNRQPSTANGHNEPGPAVTVNS